MEKSSGYSTLLRNLRYSTTPQVVREAFEKFGKIRDVYLPLDFNTRRPRGFGFVEFYEKEDALEAVKAMDNTELDGSVVSCCLAQDRRKSPSSMRRVYRNRSRRGYRSRSYSNRGRSRTPPRFRDDRRRGGSRDRSPRRGFRDRRDARGYRDRYDPPYDRDDRRFRDDYDRGRDRLRDRDRDRDFRDRNRDDRNYRSFRDEPRDRDRDRPRNSRNRSRDDRNDFRPDRDEFREDKDEFRDEGTEFDDREVEVDMDKDKSGRKHDVDSPRDYSRSRSPSNP